MYTIHKLSACISKLCNGRESTQTESKQENGVPQILGYDVVYNTVRISRYPLKTPLTFNYVICGVAIQLVSMQCLVQVQWSSLRPTQLPLMCVELATSPSGVSMME